MNGHIYMLFCQPTYRYYIGKSRYSFDHPKAHWRDYLNGSGYKYQSIFKAVKKYGADNFTSICLESDIPEDLLNCREKFFIRLFHAREGGYNRTNGGDGLDSETAREIARKCVEEGTHNFLDGEVSRRTQKKRLEEGTHHFLDGAVSRRSNKKRVEEGTHHFLGESNPVHKRVADGTHHFLDSEFQRQVQKKRLEEGTHHFLDSEIQRCTQKKRVADGTHHFLGGEIQRKRLEEGTHNLLGGEIQRRSNKKRLEEGTHHFLGDKNPAKRLAKEGRHPGTLKRLKAEWCYIIALSRFWYEIHDYTLKRRAEFLSKDIPDTSNAEQEYLF